MQGLRARSRPKADIRRQTQRHWYQEAASGWHSAKGDDRLSWHAARDAKDSGVGQHAPKVLRQGEYPAYGVYANVHMGQDDSRVEHRFDGGESKTMRKMAQPHPRLQVENLRDDLADHLRGYDRSRRRSLRRICGVVCCRRT